MQFEAKGRTVDPALAPLGHHQDCYPMVNVSPFADRLNIVAEVWMEAEAFGVLVTRRPGARVDELTSYEESRLLDVLVHMKEALSRCDDDGCEFNLWAIPSDSRDSKARAHWLDLAKGNEGVCHLSLSNA